jgi:hypothetical protein
MTLVKTPLPWINFLASCDRRNVFFSLVVISLRPKCYSGCGALQHEDNAIGGYLNVPPVTPTVTGRTFKAKAEASLFKSELQRIS